MTVITLGTLGDATHTGSFHQILIVYIGESYAITPAIMQVTATLIVLALAFDTDRIVSIYVSMPKVAKTSTIRVAVASIIAGLVTLTFTNGNTAYFGAV